MKKIQKMPLVHPLKIFASVSKFFYVVKYKHSNILSNLHKNVENYDSKNLFPYEYRYNIRLRKSSEIFPTDIHYMILPTYPSIREGKDLEMSTFY